ncbi:hypothetical protein Lal_00025744 [Lupinus albus]|nr:hypothetical protein Lal_00025744 [Lupinus albus]
MEIGEDERRCGSFAEQRSLHNLRIGHLTALHSIQMALGLRILIQKLKQEMANNKRDDKPFSHQQLRLHGQ